MADIDLHFGSLAGTVRTEHRGQLEFSAPVDTVTLPVCWRAGSALLGASRRVASRLSGPARQRALTPAAGQPAGLVSAAVFGSASHEASYLASLLRRAHAEDGVPWSEMAVLVRSAGPAADTLRRGLAAADVPVGQPVQGALTDDPVVAHLLDLLLCVADPKSVTADDAEALLMGAVGRADPLQILRMRRHLRLVPDGPLSLAELITEPAALGWLPPSARAPVQRLRAVIGAGTEAAAAGGSAEDVLWAVWQATGLASRLNRRSLAGRSDGARADRALDAVLALFIEAGKVSDRTPGSGVGQLYSWVSQLQITDASARQRPNTADEVSHPDRARQQGPAMAGGLRGRRPGRRVAQPAATGLAARRRPAGGPVGRPPGGGQRLAHRAVGRRAPAVLRRRHQGQQAAGGHGGGQRGSAAVPVHRRTRPIAGDRGTAPGDHQLPPLRAARAGRRTAQRTGRSGGSVRRRPDRSAGRDRRRGRPAVGAAGRGRCAGCASAGLVGPGPAVEHRPDPAGDGGSGTDPAVEVRGVPGL